MSGKAGRKFDLSLFGGGGGGGNTNNNTNKSVRRPVGSQNNNNNNNNNNIPLQQIKEIVHTNRKGKAIHLIRLNQIGPKPSNADQLELTEEGKGFLESLSGVFGVIVMVGNARGGKCWKKGTKLMTWPLGESKKVEDIRIGDQLMGPDSQPRQVLQLDNGEERLFRIIPERSSDQQDMIVTRNHILILRLYNIPIIFYDSETSIWNFTFWEKEDKNIKDYPKKNILQFKSYEEAKTKEQQIKTTSLYLEWEMTVLDFLSDKITNELRSSSQMIRTSALYFPIQSDNNLQDLLSLHFGKTKCTHEFLRLTAWLLGIWITSASSLNPGKIFENTTENNLKMFFSIDPFSDNYKEIKNALLHWTELAGVSYEIKEEKNKECKECKEEVIVLDIKNSNFQPVLQFYNLLNQPDKFPSSLLTDSFAVREAVLAGIMDGDIDLRDTVWGYKIVNKNSEFIEKFMFLMRSLGASKIGSLLDILSEIKNNPESKDNIQKIDSALKHNEMFEFNIRLESEISPYHGIMVSGDQRVVMEDFTISHNSFFNNYVLLNLPAGQPAFQVGTTIIAQTRGLWIYDEPVTYIRPDGSSIQALVIDTEGIGATTATATNDTKIFSLSVLLSSLLIYNSKDTIDEAALSTLDLAANISKNIKISNSGVAEAQLQDEIMLKNQEEEYNNNQDYHQYQEYQSHQNEYQQEEEEQEEEQEENDQNDQNQEEENEQNQENEEGGEENDTQSVRQGKSPFSNSKSNKRKLKINSGNKKSNDTNNNNNNNNGSRNSTPTSTPMKRTKRNHINNNNNSLRKNVIMNNTNGAMIQSKNNRAVVVVNEDTDTLRQELGAKYFPSFLWVVRDFALQLKDESDRIITENEYMEKALIEVPIDENDDNGKNDKNELRKRLKQLFVKRYCSTLVRPVVNESDLQNLGNSKDAQIQNKIRPEFIEGRSKVQKLIASVLTVKRAMDKEVSGRMLSKLCEAYVEAINKPNGVPVIKDSWSMLRESHCRDVKDDALKKLMELSKEGTNSNVTPDEYEKQLLKWKEQVITFYDSQIDSQDKDNSICITVRNQVVNEIDSKFKECRSNYELKLDEWMTNLLNKVETEVISCKTIDQLRQLISSTNSQLYQRLGVTHNYERHSNPMVLNLLARWKSKVNEDRLMMWMKKLCDNQMLELQEQLENTLNQLKSIEQQHGNCDSLIAEHKQRLDQYEAEKIVTDVIVSELKQTSQETQAFLDSKLMEHEATVGQLRHDLEMATTQMDTIQLELNRHLSESTEHLMVKEKQLTTQQLENENIKVQLTTSQADLEQCLLELQDAKEQVHQIDEWVRKFEDLKSLFQTSQNNLQESQNEYRVLQSNMDQIRQAHEEMTQQMDTMEYQYQMEKQQLILQVEQLEQNIETQKKQQQQQTKQLNEQIVDFQRQLVKYQEEKQQQDIRHEREIISLQNELQSSNKRSQQKEEEFNKTMAQLRQETQDKLTTKSQEINQLIKEKLTEQMEASRQIERAKSESIRACEILEDYKRRMETNDEMQKTKKLKADYQNLIGENQFQKQNIVMLTKQKTDKERELQEMTKRCREWESRYNQNQSEHLLETMRLKISNRSSTSTSNGININSSSSNGGNTAFNSPTKK